jgi:hypothetical protein
MNEKRVQTHVIKIDCNREKLKKGCIIVDIY